MNANQAIRVHLDLCEFVCLGYLADLSDADLLVRPCAGANHVNWQVGHLIDSEHNQIEGIAPGAMPPLPAGFSEMYSRESVLVDDPARFQTKSVLLETYRQQRAVTLRVLEGQTEADLDLPTGLSYAPTRGALLSMHGNHWMMHSGQWVIVRRLLGKGPMF